MPNARLQRTREGYDDYVYEPNLPRLDVTSYADTCPTFMPLAERVLVNGRWTIRKFGTYNERPSPVYPWHAFIGYPTERP